MKEISSFQTGKLLAVATDVSPYGTEAQQTAKIQPQRAIKNSNDLQTCWGNLNQ